MMRIELLDGKILEAIKVKAEGDWLIMSGVEVYNGDQYEGFHKVYIVPSTQVLRAYTKTKERR